jgi:hypothetical protein
VGSAGGASGITASGPSEEGSAIGGVACCAPLPGLSVLDTLGSVPRRIRDTGAVTVAPSDPSGPAASAVRARVVSVAFCPAPPLLLPEVEGRAAPETTELRDACARALLALSGAGPAAVVVVGDGGVPGVRFGAGDAADLGGWGVGLVVPFDGPRSAGTCRVPLAHALGARLLDEAGYRGTRVGVGPEDLEAVLGELSGPVAVLAMGDGSARRAVRAPGAPDEAAAGFDAGVCAALRTGDPAGLASLDPAEGERLLAAGTSTWRAVGAALRGARVAATLHYADAPFGVGYLVADWALSS